MGIQRRDCRTRNISFCCANRLSSRPRNRFHHLRLRCRPARTYAERRGGIDRARHYRSATADRRLHTALSRQLLSRVREAQQRLDHARETLQRCLAHKLDSYKRNLAHVTRALQARSPARELMVRRNRFTDLHRRLVASPARLLENARHRFERIGGILRVLGPDATLRRGYSITINERGKIVRYDRSGPAKMKIRTRVSDGEFSSEIQ